MDQRMEKALKINQETNCRNIIPDSAIEKNHYFYALNPNA